MRDRLRGRDRAGKSARKFKISVADRIGIVRTWLIALTELGDTAVLAPLAVLLLLWLLLLRSARGAAWWAIAVVMCMGLTAALKLTFYGCPPLPDLRSPSGHASFSTLVYGAITLVSATESRGFRRVMAISSGVGLILAIAASRLLLSAHSVPEIGLGLVIGTAALALFGRSYLRCRATKVWLSLLLVTGGALVLVLHGGELDAEQVLREIAGHLRVGCS
jgi:membrane-associated phospholipid phosphatase